MTTQPPISCQMFAHKETHIFLGASDSALKKSRLTGELYGRPAPKFIKYGKAIRYQRAELEAWLANSPAFQSTAEKRAAERLGAAA